MFNRNPFSSSLPGFGSIAKKAGFSWTGLLTNTQKTLGVINQAIPVFYQVRPIWNNARTIFRVVGEMNRSNKDDTNLSSNNTTTNNTKVVEKEQTGQTGQTEHPYRDNRPNFFI